MANCISKGHRLDSGRGEFCFCPFPSPSITCRQPSPWLSKHHPAGSCHFLSLVLSMLVGLCVHVPKLEKSMLISGESRQHVLRDQRGRVVGNVLYTNPCPFNMPFSLCMGDTGLVACRPLTPSPHVAPTKSMFSASSTSSSRPGPGLQQGNRSLQTLWIANRFSASLVRGCHKTRGQLPRLRWTTYCRWCLGARV